MALFVQKLQEGIAAGELPKVSYKSALVGGLPEDAIIDYPKKVRPLAIVMGTSSSSRRNMFARIFNPGIARRMLFHSDTPLLVIKGMTWKRRSRFLASFSPIG